MLQFSETSKDAHVKDVLLCYTSVSLISGAVNLESECMQLSNYISVKCPSQKMNYALRLKSLHREVPI